MRPSLLRLRGEVASGRLSRHSMLEELERHLDRDGPHLDGALDLILEELHTAPDDPHLLRLLARLYERNGDLEGARRALARGAGAGGGDEPADPVEDRLVVARVLFEVGELEESSELAREALTTEPKSLSALSLLARLSHVRGRLSETIRLWQQIHLLAPSQEGALAQLGILHRLAQDDEQSRLPLVAVGQDLYAKKPPAQLELEAAFARFRERDFAGALAACEAVATRHRQNLPLYQLAVLQKAWLQDRMDDLEGARSTLEQLGRIRGFETDLDRLAFLARVCERLGTPDTLRQALHIYEHLHVQHGKLSALPRLARLSRATGAVEAAERYQREFERRFSRRMQKPSAPEIIRGLLLRYVPLALARPCFASASRGAAAAEVEREIRLVPTPVGRRRGRALLAFLSGDPERCRRMLARVTKSRQGLARDFAYLGDALLATGHAGEAHRAYAEAARRSTATNALLWKGLLDGLERGLSPAPVRELLEDRPRAEQVRRRLWARARGAGHPGPWRDLAALERCAGAVDRSRTHEEKAARLERALAHGRDLGRVRVAAVYTWGGKPKGLVHEMLALRRKVARGTGGHLASEGGILGNATPDLRATAMAVLASTIDFARVRWPHLTEDAGDYLYSLKIAKDDEPSSGASAGLPIAVAFLSLLVGREVSSKLALSGAVVCDSQSEIALRRIGDAAHKLKGAYHAGLSTILLPEENRPDLESAEVVPISVARSMGRYASTLAEAVEVLWGLEAWDW